MENDVLKNKVAPWQEKGRWYHGVFDYPSTFNTDKSDSFLVANFEVATSGAIKFLRPLIGNEKYVIIDLKRVHKNLSSVGATVLIYQSQYLTDGRLNFPVGPNGPTSGTIEFWAFIVEV